MITTIARKETIEMLRDGRFRWATGILFVFLLASLVAGWRHYAQIRALHEKAQLEERERWLNKGEMGNHSAMHFGQYIYKHYLSLSAVDNGIASYVGAYTLLEPHKQNLFQDKPAEVEVPTRRIGEMTAAVCLQILVPLLIVMLGFAGFVGEREQGTLRQLFSLGVPKRNLIIGKALGTSVPLLLILVPAAVIGSAAILLNADALLTDTIQRLVVMIVSYILYFLIFIGLTLSVSILAVTSRQALVILLSFWFMNCLMSPLLMADLGGALFPSPTGSKFAADIGKERKEKKVHYTIRQKQIEQELLAKYKVASVKELPVNPVGIQALEEQRIDNEIDNAAFARLYGTYRGQSVVYQAGSVIAPMLAAQSLSLGLAGTDVAAHQHFAEAASRYREVMETTLNEDTAYRIPPGVVSGEALRDRELWEKVPPFNYVPPKLSWVLGNYLISIAALVVWLAFTLLVMRRAIAKATVY